MIALLSTMLMTAQADSPVQVADSAVAGEVIECEYPVTVSRAIDWNVPTRTITFDADRLNRLGIGDDLSDIWALVPGRRSLGGHSGLDMTVMLDGVVLLDQGRLGPMP